MPPQSTMRSGQNNACMRLSTIVELAHVRRPLELALHAGTAGGAGFCFHAIEFEVAEFGVGHEFAVDEQRAADAGAEREYQHGAIYIAGGAEVHLGETCRVGVVDGDDLAFEFQRRRLGERLADPGLGDIGGRVHRPADDHAGESHAGHETGVALRNGARHGIQHFADRGHGGRGDRAAFTDQASPAQVNDGRLDRRAPDINTNCLSVHSALTRSHCGAARRSRTKRYW